jgi:CRP-like cAMP-binding protein
MHILSKNDIARIPLFSGVDQEEILSVLQHCEIREFQTGQYIYRYEEYGEDCGILLSGSAKIELPRKGTLQTDKEILLHEGELFGEIAALSRYIRTADISVLEPTKILVIPRGILIAIFDKFPPIKNDIDGLYRQHILNNQLLTVPIFSGAHDKLLKEIRNKATLHSFRKGETVFNQGDKADAFYMVRYGAVKVVETGNDGKERVLAYLKGGHYFGEMALIEKYKKRMATITAINNTELIKVSGEDFQNILDSFPRIKDSMKKTIEKRKERNVQIRENKNIEMTLSDVVSSEIIQSKGILVIDTTKCIQCDSCVEACAALHDNQSRLQRKGVKLINILLLVTSCRHCDDPVCMIECPTGAIARDLNGEIYQKDPCIGCGKCARKCPYGNISIVTLPQTDGKNESRHGLFTGWFRNKRRQNRQINPVEERVKPKRKIVKCDMCREYSFIGCVYNCPSGAARRIDPAEFFADVRTIE